MIKEFKVFYDGKPASQSQLDEIEEIVVEQEIDRMWEARIKIPFCVSESGVAKGEEDPNRRAFKRVRIEARIGSGKFIPLIDGSTISQDDDRSAVPGRSFVTIIVHDDSTLLHRQVNPRNFAGKSYEKIVKEIFTTSPIGGFPEVDPIPGLPDENVVINQNGTDMQMLRSIAKRYGDYHAYVLPGNLPGVSIGCFKKLPSVVDKSIPPLSMFGECRNLDEFNIRENSLGISEFTGTTLRFSDKTFKTRTSSSHGAALLGSDPSPHVKGDALGAKRLPPGLSNLIDLERATEGWAAASGYLYTAEGSVLPLRYPGILRPYALVPVQLADSRYSGNYVISKVTHTLGRSEYKQSFAMIRNAVSDSKNKNDLAPAAAAKKAGSVNTQGITF
jgi:hypothetical protein